MERKQLMKKIIHTARVTMTGESMEDVIGKLFGMMRKQVFADLKQPIIQMDTNEVYFEEIVVKESVERYLFFFMPRKKQYFTVTASIVLTVKYIDLTKEDITC